MNLIRPYRIKAIIFVKGLNSVKCYIVIIYIYYCYVGRVSVCVCVL